MAPREEDILDEDPPSINPYEVLGLEKSASADEVKSAYRKAALKHHPGTLFLTSLTVITPSRKA
jgi:DnaJ-class molecular chaperone